jgi:hypothetical protein
MLLYAVRHVAAGTRERWQEGFHTWRASPESEVA